MDTKKPWQSKTVWLNLILAAAAFYPPVSAWVSGNMVLVTTAWAALNIVLRLISKDKIQLVD